jgi:hypothetical protein
MEMKKIVIILYAVILSVLFICQAPVTISTLQLLTNTEHVIDSSNYSGDNCQEDHFTKTGNISTFIPFRNYLSGTVSLNPLPGIPPFLLQPPQ